MNDRLSVALNEKAMTTTTPRPELAKALAAVAPAPPAPRTPAEWFSLGGGEVRWSYTTLPHRGRCRIDGAELRVRVRFHPGYDFHAVPDVLAIERWLKHRLADAPTTVEELALACADRWCMNATVKGRTATHGTITASARATLAAA